MAKGEEKDRFHDDGGLSVSTESSTTRSSTLKTDNFLKVADRDERTSLIIDYNSKEPGISLVLSSGLKDDIGCRRDSSTLELEDSTIFAETDNETSLEIDYNCKDVRAAMDFASTSKSDMRSSFDTSTTTILDDSDRQQYNTTIDGNGEGKRLEALEAPLNNDIKILKSHHSRKTQSARSILSDNEGKSELNHSRHEPEKSKAIMSDDEESVDSYFSTDFQESKKLLGDNSDKTEVSARPPRIKNCDRRFDKARSLRSFMPSRKTMIEDDTESESSASVKFQYRKRGDANFKSSLDLIYGHDEATPYNSDGPLGNSISSDRRSAFAVSRDSHHNRSFRISKNPFEMKAERIEAFCYNHGMEIAMGVLYFALNYLVAAHGAYQFTAAGGWTTDDDILRITLPIARAGGRLVTLNCALLLLTACKYLWTVIRTYVAPVIPVGFPIDDVMPKYHRYVALTVIVSGCLIHSLPQSVNYITKSISIDHEEMEIWTFWNDLAAKQLLYSGTLLAIIFSTFYLTTLKAFRKTAAGFRWFWFFHVGGVAIAYPLLLIHGTCRGRPVFLYVASLPLLLYLFDICMRRSKISKAKIIRWETHQDEGQEITELVVECPPNFEYTPGQYAEIKFPPISASEWHPFTIASAPNEKRFRHNGKKELVFYIKNLGRWTEAFFEYASAFDLSKARQDQIIYIRGPHGAPAMNYFAYKHILVIGSGVGVAPLLSIWKYLVAKGKSMTIVNDHDMVKPSSTIHKSIVDASENLSLTDQTPDVGGRDDDIAFGDSLAIASAKIKSSLHADFIFLQTILESMTVSLSLFAIFVLGETFTIVLQVFGAVSIANTIGFGLSIFALVVHGTTILVSTIAMGWRVYCRNFRCWLEFSIVFLDSIALWFSLESYWNEIDPNNQQQQQNDMEDIIIYFTIFTYVVILHAIRIFHMFYVALKPATSPATEQKEQIRNKRKKKKRGSLLPFHQTGSSHAKAELCSVEGILINRKYSSMRFAAKDLLPPIVENNLSNLYSMEFYGTREKEVEEDERALIQDMMGTTNPTTTCSSTSGSSDESSSTSMSSSLSSLDRKTSLLYGNQTKYFCAGRPDWNRIFLKAIARAHCTNEDGESVGVFFCGSPAIAKDLQAEAKRVTAQHQFAMKQLDRVPCKCKLFVHTERF